MTFTYLFKKFIFRLPFTLTVLVFFYYLVCVVFIQVFKKVEYTQL